MLAAVMPLPSEEVTPPVTKTYFAMGRGPPGVFRMLSATGRNRPARHGLVTLTCRGGSAACWHRMSQEHVQATKPGMAMFSRMAVVTKRSTGPWCQDLRDEHDRSRGPAATARAVRRFEDRRRRSGGHRSRIARLAQRTPSAGFSQGQRLVVVTDPAAAREVARICGEEWSRTASGGGSANAPRSSSRASARRSTTAATRSPTSSTRTARRSTGRSPTGGSTSGRRCRTSCSRRSMRGWLRVRRPRGRRAAPGLPGIPDEFVPIGVMPVGRPLPDIRSPSLKRGWVPFEEFARWDRWD